MCTDRACMHRGTHMHTPHNTITPPPGMSQACALRIPHSVRQHAATAGSPGTLPASSKRRMFGPWHIPTAHTQCATGRAPGPHALDHTTRQPTMIHPRAQLDRDVPRLYPIIVATHSMIQCARLPNVPRLIHLLKYLSYLSVCDSQ